MSILEQRHGEYDALIGLAAAAMIGAVIGYKVRAWSETSTSGFGALTPSRPRTMWPRMTVRPEGYSNSNCFMGQPPGTYPALLAARR